MNILWKTHKIIKNKNEKFVIEDARLMDYAQVTVKACGPVNLLVCKSPCLQKVLLKDNCWFQERLTLPSSYCVVIDIDALLESL